jgi:Ran GTPase-activating protein (RanGAP) involved in mRNA processing and transport
LDFVCSNNATTFVLEDRITGFEKALTALSPALMHRPNLETICLRNCSLGTPSVKLISDILKHNKSVQHLDLSNNLICPAACVYLHEALNINSSLLSLNLDNNQIGDKGMKLIGESLPHSELRFLSLVGNGIGDTGTHGLVEGLLASAERRGRAHKFPAFKLRENLVTDRGAKAIADLVARSGETQVIDLEKNLITDEGAIAIAQAISSDKCDLARILLAGNNLSERGVQAIHAALPKTERQVVVDFSDNKLVSRKAFIGLVNDLNLQLDFVKFKIKKAGVQINDFERSLRSHIELAEKSARSLSGASLCVHVRTRSGEPLTVLEKSASTIEEAVAVEVEEADTNTKHRVQPSSPVAA